MLTYGGIGLMGAGLFFSLGGTRFIKDAEKAAQLKRRAPILMLIGAAALGLAWYLSQ